MLRPSKRNLQASAGNYLPLTDAGNPLGCALLDFLSKGSAILTEISRLSEHNPIPATTTIERGFLFTFDEYFQNPEVQDMRINLNAKLAGMDLAFSQTHACFLERFYLLCVGIAKLGESFNQMMRDLQRGMYISHTLDQILLDADGKQWLPECLHVLATSLLLLDFYFPCTIRQNLIVAHYRANRTRIKDEFDLVMNLLHPSPSSFRARQEQQQGSSKSSLANPKQVLLRKFQVNAQVANKICVRIQNDDLYHHFRAWPSTEHRSAALARQSALLFTSLLLCEGAPQPLLAQGWAEMREIVDKFFADCWLVQICNGYVVDLGAEWYAYYPAAKAALERTTSRQAQFAANNDAQLARCQNEIDELLIRGGVLTERYVLENWEQLLDVIRQANVALRWRLQHCAKLEVHRSIRCLLSLSRLEEIVKEAVARILASKQQTFELHQSQAGNRMHELQDYFSTRNAEVSQWFGVLEAHIKALEYGKLVLDGRRILQLVRAIEEVERIDAIEDSSLQVKEFLLESKQLLEKIVAVLHVKEEILVQVEVVSDFSLELVREMDLQWWQVQFRQDPHSVSLLSSLFAKLNTCLEQTLCRIAQNSNSLDCASVADYWSRKICSFLRDKVLFALPHLVFAELDALPLVRITDSGDERYSLSKTMFKIALWAGNLPPVQTIGALEFSSQDEFFAGVEIETVQRLRVMMMQTPGSNCNGEEWKQDLERKSLRVTALRANVESLQDYFKHRSLTSMFAKAQNELGNSSVAAVYLTRFMRELLLPPRVDWFNEAEYTPLVQQVAHVFGRSSGGGTRALCDLMGEEISQAFREFTQGAQQVVALAQLDLPQNVVWGSEEWVDSVREARRRYVGFDSDFRLLKRAGIASIATRRIAYMAKLDSPPPLPPAMLDGYAATLCPKRAFLLLNELAKRMCQHNITTVFANTDFYYATAGLAVLYGANGGAHVQELDRMAELSAKALLHKSYVERKGAEASLVFKFGKQKVAKVALERLAAEQSIHRTLAFLGSRLGGSSSTSDCAFAELVAVAWS